jgi:hypothetical protein
MTTIETGITHRIQKIQKDPTKTELPLFTSARARPRLTNHPRATRVRALPTGCMVEPQSRSFHIR